MTARDFCYWLQGFFELQAAVAPGNARLTAEQSDTVRRHLAMVFAHDIDPKAGGPDVQAALNHLHGKPDGDVIVRC